MSMNVQYFAVANLRRRPVVVEIGGFVAGFDPETTSRTSITPLRYPAPSRPDGMSRP